MNGVSEPAGEGDQPISVHRCAPPNQAPKSEDDSNSTAKSPSPPLGRESRSRWWWLGIILVLGLALPVDALRQEADYGFNLGAQSDAMEAYEAAVSLIKGETRAQYLGQPNFNIQSKLPGPLWTAFCAVGLSLFGSIRGVAVLVLLTSVGAIFLTYLLVARTIGVRAALWAAFLQATSPLTVQYSIVVFNPAVMPFLGGLFFLALWRVTQRDHSRAIMWVVFLLLIMPQFHFASLILPPAAVAAYWLSRRRMNWTWLSIGLTAGVICYGPYVYGEIAHHWQNTIGMTAGRPDHYSAAALKVFIAPLAFLYNDWSPRWAYTADEYREMSRACFGGSAGVFAADFLSAVTVLLVTTGAALLGVRAMRGFWRSPRETFARSPGVTFLFVVLLVPLLCALLLGQPFQPRYALMLLAPLFGLLGAAMAGWVAQPRAARIVLPIVCGAVAVNIWFILRVYRVQDGIIETTARFIPTFRHLDRVYRTLQAHAGEERMAVLQDGEFESSLSPQEAHFLAGALLIRRYVNVRNRETGAPTSPPAPPARYVLRRGSEVEAGDPSIVYRQNGIAIVAATSEPP